MGDRFVTYRSFNDKAIATELCRQLTENEIAFEWESSEGIFDAAFSFNDLLNYYYVKLKPEDFKRANELLMNQVTSEKEEPVADYYLFSFSDEELSAVLKNPDEWNEFDQFWAKKILTSRGIEVRPEQLEQVKTEKLNQLKKPWKLDKLWLIVAVAVLVTALWNIDIIWATIDVFIGSYISFSRKTMPDGQKVKAFSEADRFLAKIVLIAGLILVIYILLQYFGVVDFMRPL